MFPTINKLVAYSFATLSLDEVYIPALEQKCLILAPCAQVGNLASFITRIVSFPSSFRTITLTSLLSFQVSNHVITNRLHKHPELSRNPKTRFLSWQEKRTNNLIHQRRSLNQKTKTLQCFSIWQTSSPTASFASGTKATHFPSQPHLLNG